MKILPTSIIAALGLAIGVSAIAAESTSSPAINGLIPSIDTMVSLPGSNIKAVSTNGRTVYMTENGRFVFTEAKLYDTWNRRYLNTIEEVQEWSSKINMERIGLNLDELGVLTYGNGEKQVVLWVDPLCDYCSAALSQMPALSSEYTFKILVVPFLGDRSAAVVRQFLCAREQGVSEKAQVEALINHSYTGLPAGSSKCNSESIEKLIVTGRVMGIDGVPYMIAPDGRFKAGLPQDGDLGKWLKGGY